MKYFLNFLEQKFKNGKCLKRCKLKCRKINGSIGCAGAEGTWLKQQQGWNGETEGKQGKLSNAKRKKVQLSLSKYRNMLDF